MGFEKGKSGNPSGKPKGAVNKATVSLRQWVNTFIDDNREQIQEDWKGLDPKDRIILFEKLLKYSLPTLQATTLQADINLDSQGAILSMTSEECKRIKAALEESI